jgi:alkylhydroperoxidase family enzyme
MTRSAKTRLELSRADDWSEETRGVLGGATPAAESPDGKGPPNILYAIGHHPSLLAPFLQFSSALAMRGVLSRRDSELLALRTAWNCRSDFEWGHHVEYALAGGLTRDEIERLPGAFEASAWPPRDGLLVRVADELHADQDLSDEVFRQLEAEFGPAEIVEMIMVVGNYTMLSMLAKATGVPLEDRLQPLPEPPL